ncbi:MULTISPECIES: uroporphyrinogen-III C-methyltransferase [unclassified Caballeronia]|uniref:uroporphyrinogen-III C-methyltransferase n=1 Tax=unclassified Caballeronia TaxID=2646786 RepID=UPI000D5E7144|nr:MULTISPECIES: uroporphyrinogen-III C-methyltransferase [unclassified Caballeronia]MDR5749798.1 uroporphyrinogen-III C-methyltransferase [Caballeronia sp. LZ024]MDR5843074.1 uroporphyrinogen-III C-methyltransferase [Caballeronia sp. LZ031]
MGKVYLIGAGPGAADLITVRGARILSGANVVLHDALIEPAMLDYAPNARRIAVGKRCGQRSTAQQFINKQIVDAAREHDVVVRLKGGDPMLFGRADEEMRALEAAGIEYEVVPGITAALASAATLKRSLTLRGVSRSVALATHSRAPDSDEIRQQASADSLVFYMGRDSAPDIAQQLIDAGRAGSTPVAIVEACSTPRERTLTLTLERMARGEAQDWLDASQPSLLMIGEAFAERASAKAKIKLKALQFAA